MTSRPSSSSPSSPSSSSTSARQEKTSRRQSEDEGQAVADGGGIATTPAAEDNEADELSPRGCEWEFRLAATVPSPAMAGASDAIGSVDFDPSGALLATAGIARKVRIYNAAALLDQQSSSPAACICVPAKLSSVRWRPASSSSGRFVGCGDYDGVVTEYDLDRGGAATWERDEHSGRRVWALDYSPPSSSPTMAASGSDDRTAHVWDPRAPSTGWATAKASGPVLCVEFDPSGAPRLAVGSADRRAALYDVRNMGRGPVATAEGHARAVTYVRWAPGDRLVTSAADGTHRLWDWAAAAGMVGPGREVRAYSGHTSGRSFVGMGLWRGPGLVACGSESNHVFVYDLRWPKPVWVHPFVVPGGGGFVSAVAWRQQAEDGGGGEGDAAGALVAGGSDGVLKLFTCRRRRRRRRDGEEDDDQVDVDGEHQ